MGTKDMCGKKRLRVRFAALALLFSLLLGACSSAKTEDMAVAPAMKVQDQYGGAAESPSEAETANSVQAVSNGAPAAQASSDAVQAGSAGGAAAGGGIAPEPGAGTARKVIYKANVSMKVEDFDAADQQLRDAIHLSGAYMLQFSNTVDAGGKGAAYVIKVPADGFSDFIDRLRQIEKDLQLQLEGSDVTEEYVDLNARLQAKQTAEARLLSFMDKAEDSDDLVRFSSELAAVQEQIEQIKGRIRYLDQNVAYSTVNVRISERAGEEKGDPFGERLIGALTGSARTLGQFGQALLVFLAALLPVAAVAAAIGVPVYLILRASQRARREAAAERRKQWNGALPGAGAMPPAGSLPDQAGLREAENSARKDPPRAPEGNTPPQKESE